MQMHCYYVLLLTSRQSYTLTTTPIIAIPILCLTLEWGTTFTLDTNRTRIMTDTEIINEVLKRYNAYVDRPVIADQLDITLVRVDLIIDKHNHPLIKPVYK